MTKHAGAEMSVIARKLDGMAGSVARSGKEGIRSMARYSSSHRVGSAGVVVLVLLVLTALLAGFISPYQPDAVVGAALRPPSWMHLLGTDALGRDVMSRAIWGTRSALTEGILAIGLGACVGVPIGAISGYVGGWPAAVVQRLVDISLAFPALMLALLIVAIEGPGGATAILAAGVAFIPVFARLAFSIVTRLMGEEYLTAARVVGCSQWRILTRYVWPTMVGDLAVLVSSGIGWAVLLIATLSFLGVGAQPPTPDWGADLAAGDQYRRLAWWISLAPGICLALLSLGANYTGEVIADLLHTSREGAIGPKARGSSVIYQGAAEVK